VNLKIILKTYKWLSVEKVVVRKRYQTITKYSNVLDFAKVLSIQVVQGFREILKVY
jgi:hypothetical protein